MKEPDVYILKPHVLISEDRTAVSVWAETMTLEHPRGSGTEFRLAMSTRDAMRLMTILQGMQRAYNLPVPAGKVSEVDVSKGGEKS